MRANGDNLAIKPSFVDAEKIRIESMEFVQIESINEEQITYRVNPIDYANSFDKEGCIEWQGRKADYFEKQTDFVIRRKRDGWLARQTVYSD